MLLYLVFDILQLFSMKQILSKNIIIFFAVSQKNKSKNIIFLISFFLYKSLKKIKEKPSSFSHFFVEKSIWTVSNELIDRQ